MVWTQQEEEPRDYNLMMSNRKKTVIALNMSQRRAGLRLSKQLVALFVYEVASKKRTLAGLALICMSSSSSCRLCLTLRALSLLAMRLLILRLSCSVNSGAFGSPLYAMGLPTFFFSLPCQQIRVESAALLMPSYS